MFSWELGTRKVYCRAQFQLAVAVAIELSLALLSLFSTPNLHPVKVSKQFSTVAGKWDFEDGLNYLLNGRSPQLSFE
jgi:hypothetical protein